MPCADDYLFAALSRARNRIFRESAAEVRPSGLTLTQFEVLEALDAHGPLSMGGIQATIFGTQGNVPLVARNLERDGLVSLGRSDTDARVHMVSLTEAGRTLVRATYPRVMGAIGRRVSALDDGEKRQLWLLLSKVARDDGRGQREES